MMVSTFKCCVEWRRRWEKVEEVVEEVGGEGGRGEGGGSKEGGGREGGRGGRGEVRTRSLIAKGSKYHRLSLSTRVDLVLSQG